MTNEQAITLMKSAKSIKDWNKKRDEVRTKVSQAQWEGTKRNGLQSIIDGSGLVVEVLGPDVTEEK